ncbi:hypothetical protein [Spongiactinospora gelatinilytica]|uniref:hypothetical protein n=1 Tax=Spongiactinospora gelatinilytica TaxID=2666298 RepID=UPI0011B94B56|nr:hypothetical protein [Spongiactinospora gelatinilytica]
MAKRHKGQRQKWSIGLILGAAALGLLVHAVMEGAGAPDQLASVIGAMAVLAGLGIGLVSMIREPVLTTSLSALAVAVIRLFAP